jgi:hypothetical protein
LQSIGSFQLERKAQVSQGRDKMHKKGRQRMVSSEHFRAELQAQMERAATRGQKHIVINALELHVALGLFPRPNHHTAADVMEYERRPGDVMLVEKSDRTGLTIRYLLPRVVNPSPRSA